MQPRCLKSNAGSQQMSDKEREDFRTRRGSLANARRLRGAMTEAEKRLWFILRGSRFDGVKFKRQVLIGTYIVDFVSLSTGLIIELDGGQHDSQREYDARRTAYLDAHGYRVLRFWNNEVFEHFDYVLET